MTVKWMCVCVIKDPLMNGCSLSEEENSMCVCESVYLLVEM